MQNLTTFDAALKEHYTNWRVQNMVYQDRPLLALLPKMEEFGGRELPLPVIFGNPQGIGSSFSQAQGRAANVASSITQFKLIRQKYYGITQVDGETIEASTQPVDAWLPALTTEIDGIINGVSNSLAVYLYGDGSGVLGQMANSTVSTSVVTLANPDDISHFEVGMELDAAAAVSTGGVRGYGSGAHGLYIISVDRSAGTFVVGTAAGSACDINDSTDGLVTPSTTDYLFRRSDRNNVITGVGGWLPTSVDSNDSFMGVNRSSDRTRLAGQFLDASVTAMSIEESLVRGAALVAREGGKIDHFFMHFSTWANLASALGSKVEYVDLDMEDVSVSFRSIVINGPKGPIKVIPDQFCPSNRVFGLQLESDIWQVASLGEFVKVLDSTDGLQMLRMSTADAAEVRYGSRSQLGCRGPGWNVCIKLS